MTALGFELQDGRWDTRAETRGGWIEYAEAPYGPASAGRAPSTTSPGPRRWRTTRPGTTASPKPAAIRRRSSTASGSARSTSASRAGVLFEIATLGPGFATDEDPAHLGEKLILPPAFEHLRDRVEPVLTPLPDPRADWAAR